MEAETATRKRRSWPVNMVFLGGGMVLGGGVDISGPGGAILLVGIVIALFGFGGLLFTAP